MAVVTRDEFQEWAEHPVTVHIRKQVQRDLDNMKMILIECDAEDLKEIQGRCKAALQIVNLEYEDLYE